MYRQSMNLDLHLSLIFSFTLHPRHHRWCRSPLPAWRRHPQPPPGWGWWTWRVQPAPEGHRSRWQGACTGRQRIQHLILSSRGQSLQTRWWWELWKWNRNLRRKSNFPMLRKEQHLKWNIYASEGLTLSNAGLVIITNNQVETKEDHHR